MPRLPDAVLDDCLCDPTAPFARDPTRHWGLDKDEARERLEALKPWLNEQQTKLWANRQAAMLLVLQGPDCSGKDGLIRRVIGAFAPQGLCISSFQAPDAQERQQDFLLRYRQRLPGPGLLGVFNRSHYEGLVSDPLDGLCTTAEVPQRLARVIGLEQSLAPATHLLKCHLQISRDEQKQRLLRRLERPEKRWKLKPSDLLAYRQFDRRQALWAEVLGASHSPPAPWYVIPADHRWLRDLLVASLLARAFEGLRLAWPDRPPPFGRDDLLDESNP